MIRAGLGARECFGFNAHSPNNEEFQSLFKFEINVAYCFKGWEALQGLFQSEFVPVRAIATLIKASAGPDGFALQDEG